MSAELKHTEIPYLWPGGIPLWAFQYAVSWVIFETFQPFAADYPLL